MDKINLFKNIQSCNEETFLKLIDTPNIKIERIVSSGQTTPENFWYNQKQNEFVMIVQGEAIIEYEEGHEVRLKTGDCINIEAHCKHRVKYTCTQQETIWLAVFYE